MRITHPRARTWLNIRGMCSYVLSCCFRISRNLTQSKKKTHGLQVKCGAGTVCLCSGLSLGQAICRHLRSGIQHRVLPEGKQRAPCEQRTGARSDTTRQRAWIVQPAGHVPVSASSAWSVSFEEQTPANVQGLVAVSTPCFQASTAARVPLKRPSASTQATPKLVPAPLHLSSRPDNPFTSLCRLPDLTRLRLGGAVTPPGPHRSPILPLAVNRFAYSRKGAFR